MKKYLLSAALAGAFCSPAYAATNIGGSETFSTAEVYGTSAGGPSITGQEANHTAFSLTVGGPGITFNAFTLNPAGLCSGGGCVGGIGGTETDQITFTITGLLDAPAITETGLFEAKYSGSEIGCASGDGKSGAGESDCFIWSGATSTFNGSFSKLVSLTGALAGDDLDVVFHNATDWSITPTVTLSLVDAPAVGTPEPSTWAMGLVGFAFMAYMGYSRAASRRTGRVAV
jgi:hypothetical protein